MSIFTFLILTLLNFAYGQTYSDKALWIEATQCTITYRVQKDNIALLRCASLRSETQNWAICKTACCLRSRSMSR
jgi:hypothetical protein